MLETAALLLAGVIAGCGTGATAISLAPASTALSISPATAVVQQGDSYTFAVKGYTGDVSSCKWQAADSSVLTTAGAGRFVAGSVGSTSVNASCGGESASSSAVVTAPTVSAPIKITAGGTYSGNWASSDPAVPAVTIATDQPVTIQNSTVSGKGTLIFARGVSAGAQITISDVTGVALDPGVAGLQRGRFIDIANARTVSITHTTATGVSLGIVIGASTLTQLVVNNNSATNLEDRTSDGKGGFTANRPELGHFIYLNAVKAPSGGEIAWNQAINTPGSASVEDMVNLYNSRGSTAGVLSLHDNYLQGEFAPSTSYYTGAGIITDGDSNDAATATGFVDIRQNQIVHTANGGVAIVSGHDTSVTANRVVSCGKDASGVWYATGGNIAFSMWNYYKTTQFYNNNISGNGGGLVGPDGSGKPVASNLWTPDVSAALRNVVGTNSFTDPCLVGGVLNLQAEADELTSWKAKLAAASQTVGSRR